MEGINWSIVVGLIGALGLPGLGGLFILVRMENRVTTLEKGRNDDNKWLTSISEKLDAISRDLNQLIGAQNAKE